MEENRFGWFLAGAVIGAGVALLVAPKSGKETREYLNQATQEGKDAVGSGGREVVELAKDLYDRGRQLAEDASELFERGRKLVQG
jgi:gas vesicle protein